MSLRGQSARIGSSHGHEPSIWTQAQTIKRTKIGSSMTTQMRDLWQDETGSTAVEYAFLMALVVLPSVAAWQGLRVGLVHAFNAATSHLSSAQ